MAKFVRVSIGTAVLVAMSFAAQAADLSVTPIYKTRTSTEQATPWRGFYLGPAGSSATGKIQDTASRPVTDGTFFKSITAGAHERSGMLVYGVAGE
jgi:hypothetical protein